MYNVKWRTDSFLKCHYLENSFEGQKPFENIEQGDLVLVKDQVNLNENGIYKITRLKPFKMMKKIDLSKLKELFVFVESDFSSWKMVRVWGLNDNTFVPYELQEEVAKVNVNELANEDIVIKGKLDLAVGEVDELKKLISDQGARIDFLTSEMESQKREMEHTRGAVCQFCDQIGIDQEKIFTLSEKYVNMDKLIEELQQSITFRNQAIREALDGDISAMNDSLKKQNSDIEKRIRNVEDHFITFDNEIKEIQDQLSELKELLHDGLKTSNRVLDRLNIDFKDEREVNRLHREDINKQIGTYSDTNRRLREMGLALEKVSAKIGVVDIKAEDANVSIKKINSLGLAFNKTKVDELTKSLFDLTYEHNLLKNSYEESITGVKMELYKYEHHDLINRIDELERSTKAIYQALQTLSSVSK